MSAGALGAMLMYFLSSYQPFVEAVGFAAVFTEAMLGKYACCFEGKVINFFKLPILTLVSTELSGR